MKPLILLLWCMLAAVCSFATNEDGKGMITGKVLTVDGNPAAAVTITLKGTNRGTT